MTAWRIAILPTIAKAAATPPATLPWAAIVDARYTGTVGAPGTVGVPTFRHIGDALSGTSVNSGVRTVIVLRNGRHYEKLTIDRPRITPKGESRDDAVITFGAVSDTLAPGGGTYGTRGSYTLRIVGPDFRAELRTNQTTRVGPQAADKPVGRSNKSSFSYRTAAAPIAICSPNGSMLRHTTQVLLPSDNMRPIILASPKSFRTMGSIL